MSKETVSVKLPNGTMIRHKTMGYTGQIDGTTWIQECFTSKGESIAKSPTKDTFQYRVIVPGENMRRIAPAEDLEILESVAEVTCSSCRASFRTVPGSLGKPRGLCRCGYWICPACLCCQGTLADQNKTPAASCAYQRKRLVKKLALEKKATRAETIVE